MTNGKTPDNSLSSNDWGRIRTCDLRVMSPNQGTRWATWGSVSSGFREIEIGRSLWGMLPHLLPQQTV
jgi:hypothetical protein